MSINRHNVVNNQSENMDVLYPIRRIIESCEYLGESGNIGLFYYGQKLSSVKRNIFSLYSDLKPYEDVVAFCGAFSDADHVFNTSILFTDENLYFRAYESMGSNNLYQYEIALTDVKSVQMEQLSDNGPSIRFRLTVNTQELGVICLNKEQYDASLVKILKFIFDSISSLNIAVQGNAENITCKKTAVSARSPIGGLKSFALVVAVTIICCIIFMFIIFFIAVQCSDYSDYSDEYESEYYEQDNQNRQIFNESHDDTYTEEVSQNVQQNQSDVLHDEEMLNEDIIVRDFANIRGVEIVKDSEVISPDGNYSAVLSALDERYYSGESYVRYNALGLVDLQNNTYTELIRSISGEYMDGIDDIEWSFDSKYIYFSVRAYAVTNEIYNVNIDTGYCKDICPGVFVGLIKNGKYKGLLAVIKTSIAEEGGRIFFAQIVNDDGECIMDLGEEYASLGDEKLLKIIENME